MREADRVSLGCCGCPGTRSVAQAALCLLTTGIEGVRHQQDAEFLAPYPSPGGAVTLKDEMCQETFCVCALAKQALIRCSWKDNTGTVFSSHSFTAAGNLNITCGGWRSSQCLSGATEL